MRTQIILISHALTQWNMDNKDQGHVNTPLNPCGFRMVEALAEKLQDEHIDAVYSSDLLRAYQTAKPLAMSKGLPVVQLVCLRECRKIVKDTGGYEMLPFSVDVESREDLRKRVVEGITRIAADHDGKSVLIVSHEGAVRQFIAHLQEQPGSRVPDYTNRRSSINRFVYEDGYWTCTVMNDADYLTEITDGVSDR